MPELTPPEPIFEHLSAQADDLRTALLQRSATTFLKARELEGLHGGYLQGVYLDTPEPTTAFRMDSKDAYLVHGKMSHKTLYVYIPKTHDPETYPRRVWYKYVDAEGIEAMYELSENFQPYESPEDLHERAVEEETAMLHEEIDMQDNEEYEGEVDSYSVNQELILENIVGAAIKQKELSIKGMRQLSRDMRSLYRIVPFEG